MRKIKVVSVEERISEKVHIRGGKISLFGNFGTLNLGNECTLQAIIHNIYKSLPKAEINCICSNPEDVLARHKVAAFPMFRRSTGIRNRKLSPGQKHLISRLMRILLIQIPIELMEWVRAIKVLKGRDALIMVGTGMLTDSGEGAFGLPYHIFKWSTMAKMCGCKVLFVSVGVEPIQHLLTKWFIKSALCLADYRCYRDLYSKNYLKSAGFNSDDDHIYPDLAFSLPEPMITDCSYSQGEEKVVGVGLYDYYGNSADSLQRETAYRDYLNKISQFIAWLAENGYTVRLLIGDLLYDVRVKQDLNALLKKKKIAYAEGQIIDEPVSSVEQLLAQIGTTDLVVASRYHNILLSLMLNKSVISISYNEKNDSIMNSVGLDKFCQQIETLNIELLIEQFKELEIYNEKLKIQIRQKIKEYRNKLARQYLFIFKEMK